VTGELKPGQRVAQDEVAERCRVSVAPVREALRMLEGEGQVTYLPRRGYFVTELRIQDLEEIYELRRLLEELAVRHALPALDDEAFQRAVDAAAECKEAASQGDVAAELVANRRFHFAILEVSGRPHLMHLIISLWDSTEAYRALYYDLPSERLGVVKAHDRILRALRKRDADELVAELDAHRERALEVLKTILGAPA
jgi:DNA-binding GntR family transcriptional regulator